METRTIREESELREISEALLASLKEKSGAHVFALHGDLGAGKTALTKALARTLDITEEVTSPTFVIMKSYDIPEHPFLKTLFHVDAYRIESLDEMRVLGFTDLLGTDRALIAIEWPERIEALIPKDALHVHLTIEKDGSRTITYGT